MPPKIERYATEPKKNSKLTQRQAGKAAYEMRSFGRKTMDIKRYSVYNKIENILFQQGDTINSTFSHHENKKKSFIVSKRKNNKSMLMQCQQHPNKLRQKNENNYIQKVQSQSYQGLRDYNEDRILIKQNITILGQSASIFAIFDGHGGSSAAEYLKINFVRIFINFTQSFGIKESLKKAIQELELKILQNGIKIGSGSCATILVLKSDQYWAANVGDSRILIIKGMQQFVQVTEDHKPQNPHQYKRIQNLGGRIYRNTSVDESTGEKSYGPYRIFPSRLSVSRAIGDYLIKKSQSYNIISWQPDIFCGKVDYNDVFLLMSDGGYQKFSNTQLSILFSHQTQQSLRHRFSNYLSSAKKRNTNDNASLIGIQICCKPKNQKIIKNLESQKIFSEIQIRL